MESDKIIYLVKSTHVDDQQIKCLTPKSNYINQNIRVEISDNKINWFRKIKPETYLTLYDGPVVKNIIPSFGEGKKGVFYNISVNGRNFNCLNNRCDKYLKCRFQFSGKENSIIVSGTYKSNTEVFCPVPKINRAIVLYVSISIDGRDFSTDNVTFTFFDPFILGLSPEIISISGKILFHCF